MKRPREDAEFFRARREALAKLTNQGCSCENYAWDTFQVPVNGHHPACRKVCSRPLPPVGGSVVAQVPPQRSPR